MKKKSLWDLDKLSKMQFIILKIKQPHVLAFKLMIMTAKRAKLRAKSYRENVELAPCLTAPMLFILSVGLRFVSFCRSRSMIKSLVTIPSDSNQGQPRADVPVPVRPQTWLSCAHQLVFWIPAPSASFSGRNSWLLFPVLDWLSGLSQSPLERFPLLVSKISPSPSSLLFLSFSGCSFSSHLPDLDAL